ncbi:MAG TPA: S9 family peptidase, partial [Mycobacteriales bacterium]|nr:S9 family peptidase [Mycobacteriales bacterium]
MTDYADLAAFLSLPRLTGLALSPDGSRLVAAVQRPDAKNARYVSSLWEVPLAGGEPVRLTRSEKGESAPAFRPDGSLLFISSRPDPDGEEDETALWVLPPVGEPRVLARSAGGLSGPVVAADAGTVVVAGSRLPGSADPAGDGARRTVRKDRRINAILHTGLPIRYWDHELGVDEPRLLVLGPEGGPRDAAPRDVAGGPRDAAGGLRDLAPDAGPALVNADYSITADGATVATTWRTRGPGGTVDTRVVLIDVATGTRTPLPTEADCEHETPRIAPDGSAVALLRFPVEGTYETPTEWDLLIVPVAGGPAVPVEVGDLYPNEWVWSADAGTLYV